MIRRVFELLLDVAFGRREGPESYVSPTTGERHW